MKRKAVKSKLDKDWDCCKSLRNKVTRQIELTKRDYYNTILTENAHDSSRLWSAIRKLIPKKTKATVQEIKLDEESFTDNFGIANCFNKFFTALGARLRTTLLAASVTKHVFCVSINKEVPDFTFKDRTSQLIQLYAKNCLRYA